MMQSHSLAILFVLLLCILQSHTSVNPQHQTVLLSTDNDSTHKLSALQRPRKPHRYIKRQNATSRITPPSPIHQQPKDAEHSSLVVRSNTCETLHVDQNHVPSDLKSIMIPPTSSTQQSSNQLLNALTCFMAMRWNRNIRRIIGEMDQLFQDAIICSEESLKMKKRYLNNLKMIRKLYLFAKNRQRSEKAQQTISTQTSTSASFAAVISATTIIQDDIQIIANKQYEYIQSLEAQMKDSVLINKLLDKENKDLRCSLYRTEVALRESNYDKDQLESKISLLSVQTQLQPQDRVTRREYDVSTIHNINSCILIASRAQKYETYTDQVIQRLEGQLRNVSIQLSRYHTAIITNHGNDKIKNY